MILEYLLLAYFVSTAFASCFAGWWLDFPANAETGEDTLNTAIVCTSFGVAWPVILLLIGVSRWYTPVAK